MATDQTAATVNARLAFPIVARALIPVTGSDLVVPPHRIFCVGRNFVEHAREMGAEPDPAAPFFFTKSPVHLALSGGILPYPPGTSDLHHEVELVVALGEAVFQATRPQAARAVFGYAAGLDMTRRDLQAEAKDKRRPWDTGKDFEGSAIVGPLTLAADFTPARQRIALTVNGNPRQAAHLDEMIHDVPALIGHLSQLYPLRAGDLIFCGTPAGVGPVGPGDHLCGRIDGLAPVELTLGAGPAATGGAP